jgi:hypothetical protein
MHPPLYRLMLRALRESKIADAGVKIDAETASSCLHQNDL